MRFGVTILEVLTSSIVNY